MSPLLKKKFKSSKCKTLIKLTVSRIKLLRNKKLIVVKQSRKDVSELLRTGQESNARIRVENVYREENSLAAYELIEQYCEAIVSRLSTLESQKPCPSDMKEPITSLLYAAQRCADLPELQKVRDLFVLKYGKEFAVSASELRQDCGVSVQIIQSLSSHPPNGKTKLKLLKEIASEHKIAWDSNKAVSESFKISEDLLDGPSQFVSASELPQTNSLAPAVSGRENSDSMFSRPVIASDLKESSAPAPSPEAHRKIFLSPYASRFQDSPASTSGFPSSDSSNELSSTKGTFPPSGKHDSLPQDMPLYTRLEPDTRTKSQADNRAKSQETSEVGVDDNGRAEGSQSCKNMDNLRIQRDPHHGSLKSDADPYARAKAEGRMDYGDMSFKAQTSEAQHDSQQKEEKIKITQESAVPHLAHPKEEKHRSFNKEIQDKTNNEVPVLSNEMQDGNLARQMRPPSLKLTKSYSKEGKDGGSPYPDVATAAQVAFESAALAAEAAKAAIDLVRMDSERKSNDQTDEADSFERVNEVKSKLRVEKVAQAMRNSYIEMDSKQNLQREEHEEKVSESEDETPKETLTPLEEIGSPDRGQGHVSVYQRPLELSNLHAVIEFSREQKERILPCNQESGFSGIIDQSAGGQELNFDGAMQNFFSDQILPQEDESEKICGSMWMHQNTSCQREPFGKKGMQEVPRFDDYESDEATDTDTPFYTKGRGASDKERYEQIGSSLSVNKPKESNVFPRVTHSISFIDHGSDSGEESAFDNQKFKTTSHDRDFVQREVEGFAGRNYSGKPEFDSFEEPTISQSLFGGHNHCEERLKGSENSYTGLMDKLSPVSIDAESDKHSKSDKAAHQRLKWHSSTSEEHDSPSQSGELSSEADELYLVNLHSRNGNDSSDCNQGWIRGPKYKGMVEKKTRHNLNWQSASDEFDNPSHSDELSPEANEFGAVKVPSENEHGQRSHNLDRFIVPQSSRSSETAEPYQVPKLLKGKPFYGESRRSVRSGRSQQRQELPSLAASYERVNTNLPSIFEASHSDEKGRKI